MVAYLLAHSVAMGVCERRMLSVHVGGSSGSLEMTRTLVLGSCCIVQMLEV